jgi:DNA-directed RNA polymerase subunit E"
MVRELACRDCKCVTVAKICPSCKSTDLSPDWNGIALIVNPSESKIAKALGITKQGKYALKVT